MKNEKTEKTGDGIPRYLSIKQFMERTTLSKTTVWRRIKADRIRPVIRDEGRVLIGIEALTSLADSEGGAREKA